MTSIYTLLREKPLSLQEIPTTLHAQLEKSLADGWATQFTENGTTYYTLKIFLMPKPTPPDSRDYKYEQLIAGAAPIPQSHVITCTEFSPWTIQARNICTALAAVKAKFILDMQKFPNYRTHHSNVTTPCNIITESGIQILELPYQYPSAEYIFQRGGGTSSGANANAVLNAARQGMIYEHDQPTAYSGNRTFPIPTSLPYKPADHSISGYARLASYQSALQALAENRPVYVVYPIFSSYNTVMSGQTQTLPASGSIIGYHASTIIGYKETGELIIEQTYAGANKMNFMTRDYFAKYVQAAYVITDGKETELLASISNKTETTTKPATQSTTATLKSKIKKILKYTL
jgi:hypothetical protein